MSINYHGPTIDVAVPANGTWLTDSANFTRTNVAGYALSCSRDLISITSLHLLSVDFGLDECNGAYPHEINTIQCITQVAQCSPPPYQYRHVFGLWSLTVAAIRQHFGRWLPSVHFAVTKYVPSGSHPFPVRIFTSFVCVFFRWSYSHRYSLIGLLGLRCHDPILNGCQFFFHMFFKRTWETLK